MSIQFEHIKKDTLTTRTWSGGTTTQLAIYPKGSEYSKRDFKWRVSSATVETDVSTFTSLPGILRYITTLCGTLKLEHKNYHTVTLDPFEVDRFDGAWETISYGQVTDFNLMLSRGTQGILRTKRFSGHCAVQFEALTDLSSKRTLGIYAANAPLEASFDKWSATLETGELLLLTTDTDFNGIDIHTQAEHASICIIEIRL